MRILAKQITENNRFQGFILALIIINAVILGLETHQGVMAAAGPWLVAVDHAILWVFVVELALRLLAMGGRFFRDPWSVFDTFVVAVALMPAQEAYSVLRALRVLRVLRLISAVPRLRRVVQGLITAIPGIGAIAFIMLLIFYVFAVMAVKLFGTEYPQWFGSLGESFFTLFQIMTLEGWAEIVREIMVAQPHAWIFFVIYILAATFTVLNLFIAVIVEAMQSEHKLHEQELNHTEHMILEEIKQLRDEVRQLRAARGLPPQ